MIRANDNTTSGSGLTPQQRMLLDCFGKMSDTAQQFILDCAANNARAFPRQRPKLRVIGGRAA